MKNEDIYTFRNAFMKLQSVEISLSFFNDFVASGFVLQCIKSTFLVILSSQTVMDNPGFILSDIPHSLLLFYTAMGRCGLDHHFRILMLINEGGSELGSIHHLALSHCVNGCTQFLTSFSRLYPISQLTPRFPHKSF